MAVMNDKERLARQRLLLRKRLGLDEVAGVSVVTPGNDELFKEEDFVIDQEPFTYSSQQVGLKYLC